MVDIFLKQEDGETLAQYFGYRLGVIRKARKMSQKELSDKAGISLASVTAYENGNTEPVLRNVCSLADALGVSTDVLCGREPKEAAIR